MSIRVIGQVDVRRFEFCSDTSYRFSSYRLNTAILRKYVMLDNVNSFPSFSPSFVEYRAFKEYTLQTKLLVVSVNVAGAVILLHKYSWTEQSQKIITPVVFCAVIPITFYKAIEWNRFKRSIY